MKKENSDANITVPTREKRSYIHVSSEGAENMKSLAYDGVSLTEIAKRYNCHRKTVANHLTRLEKAARGETEEKLKRGRKRRFEYTQLDIYVKEAIDKNNELTAKQIAKYILDTHGLNLNRYDVRRGLKRLGVTFRNTKYVKKEPPKQPAIYSIITSKVIDFEQEF